MNYRKVSDKSELKKLAELAARIWNVHYPPIIGQKQVDYMLAMMYSQENLNEQIRNGHTFIAAYDNEEMLGFISYSMTSEKQFMIHKWYVDVTKHGKGIGRGLFDAAFENIKYKEFRLTVNRKNIQAVNFYFKFGFTIEKVIDMDIGEGFVMNDFVMLLKPGAKR